LIGERLAKPSHGAVEMMQLKGLSAFDPVVGSPLFRRAVRALEWLMNATNRLVNRNRRCAISLAALFWVILESLVIEFGRADWTKRGGVPSSADIPYANRRIAVESRQWLNGSFKS
jgi:hypothetical protein